MASNKYYQFKDSTQLFSHDWALDREYARRPRTEVQNFTVHLVVSNQTPIIFKNKVITPVPNLEKIIISKSTDISITSSF